MIEKFIRRSETGCLPRQIPDFSVCDLMQTAAVDWKSLDQAVLPHAYTMKEITVEYIKENIDDFDSQKAYFKCRDRLRDEIKKAMDCITEGDNSEESQVCAYHIVINAVYEGTFDSILGDQSFITKRNDT